MARTVRTSILVSLFLGTFFASNAGEPALLGSPAWSPSPEQPIGWRGDGTGRYPAATPPTTWSRKKSGENYAVKNIVWAAPLPNGGVSSPIVVGNKIFLTTETFDVVCVDKQTGKLLWIRSNPEFEGLSDDERKANPLYAEKLAPLLPELAKANAEAVEELNAQAANAATSMVHPNLGKKRELEKKIYDEQMAIDKKLYERYWGQAVFGFAGQTVTSDGKNVCAFFTTGVSCCYDLDGNRKWITRGPGHGSEHGNFASPVLCKNRFVVWANELRAYDVETGKLAWSAPARGSNCYGSLFRLPLGNDCIAGFQFGYFARVSDGKPVWGQGIFGDAVETPIYENGTLYACVGYPRNADGLGFKAFTVPTTETGNLKAEFTFNLNWPADEIPVDKDKARFGYITSFTASPLFVDGLIYHFSEAGGLLVNDATTGKSVYRKILPMKPRTSYWNWGGASASPTLAGKYIYLVDNQGTTVVIEPGKQYKEVAANVLEESVDGKEQTQNLATPVFEGSRLYYRSPCSLYCIAQVGPYVDKTIVTKDSVTFSFKQADGNPASAAGAIQGLTNTGKDAASGELKGLVITDAAGAAKPAAVKIEGNTVIVAIKGVPVPFGISYTGTGEHPLPESEFSWNAVRVLKCLKCFDQTIVLTSNLPLSDYWSNAANFSVAGAKVTAASITAEGVKLTTDKSWKAGDAVSLTYPCFQVDQGEPRRETLSFTAPEIVRATAKFVKTDETTSGNWKGVYGTEGALVERDAGSTPPKWAEIAPKNQEECTWAETTQESRAPLKSGDAKDRIAACWFSDSAFDLDIGISDGKEHQIAVYLLDWDAVGRAAKVEVRDAATDTVLDSQTVANFKNGKYLVWNIKGHASLHFISTGNVNATVSAVFIDPPGQAGK